MDLKLSVKVSTSAAAPRGWFQRAYRSLGSHDIGVHDGREQARTRSKTEVRGSIHVRDEVRSRDEGHGRNSTGMDTELGEEVAAWG